MNQAAIDSAQATQAQRLAIVQQHKVVHGSDGVLARFKAAAQAHTAVETARSKGLSVARALTRKAGIRTSTELLAAMQNVLSAVQPGAIDSALCNWRDALGELCLDMDGDLNTRSAPCAA